MHWNCKSPVSYGAVILVMSCLLCSCYAYKVYPKEYRRFRYSGARTSAYVSNPELKKEFAILRSARIFELTSDSVAAEVKIRLVPMQQTILCGQPIVLSLITFGQVPVLFPDQRVFQFDEYRGEERVSRRMSLQVMQRFWFWDMFTFDKNFKKKAGQALAGAYFSNDPGFEN